MRRKAKQKHTPTEHYILQTAYDTEGGPQGQISRLFFGVAKRCLCRQCLDKQGREDIKRLRARGIVA